MKKFVAELGLSDLLPVYEYNCAISMSLKFAKKQTIFHELPNGF